MIDKPLARPVPPAASDLHALAADTELQAALGVVERAWARYRYSYNFTWLGVPIIQIPQDIIALQEIIWATAPELIIETGIAHGGSLVFSASLLQLLGNNGRVIGIDIDLRPHNRAQIENHALSPLITCIEGSSIDPAVVAQVAKLARNKRTMVILDSNHTHAHVLEELRLYAPLVSPGLYCAVMDTVVERMPPGSYENRPWDRGDNPATAVAAFLATTGEFQIDETFDAKLGLSMAPRGYLRRLA